MYEFNAQTELEPRLQIDKSNLESLIDHNHHFSYKLY